MPQIDVLFFFARLNSIPLRWFQVLPNTISYFDLLAWLIDTFILIVIFLLFVCLAVEKNFIGKNMNSILGFQWHKFDFGMRF